MYTLEKFGNLEGYSIEWEELAEIIEKVYPDKELCKDWYRKWQVSNWVKEDKDRSYINLRTYHNKKLNSQESLGYYDNLERRYIITNHNVKVIDVIEVYQTKQ